MSVRQKHWVDIKRILNSRINMHLIRYWTNLYYTIRYRDFRKVYVHISFGRDQACDMRQNADRGNDIKLEASGQQIEKLLLISFTNSQQILRYSWITFCGKFDRIVILFRTA